MTTEEQLESVQQSLYHTQIILIIGIVLAVILLGIFIYRHIQMRNEHYYRWYNPETGWLNQTYFVETPQKSQVFWADDDFWVILRVDYNKRRLEVGGINPDDILQEA